MPEDLLAALEESLKPKRLEVDHPEFGRGQALTWPEMREVQAGLRGVSRASLYATLLDPEHEDPAETTRRVKAMMPTREERLEKLSRRALHALHALICASKDLNSPVTAAEVLIYDEESLSAQSTGQALRAAAGLGFCVYVPRARLWVPSNRALDLRTELEGRFLRDTFTVEGHPVLFEEADGAFGAYVPDQPGCVAAGESWAEVEELITDAVRIHLEGLAQQRYGDA